jgi:hypothetical protein
MPTTPSSAERTVPRLTAAGASRSEPEAIFIVGVSRSGTTLLRRVLETSERVAIATENHFLGHLIESEGARHYFRRLGDLHGDGTIRRLVEHIYSGEYQRKSRLREVSPYWRWLVKTVPRTDIERRLLDGERSERGLMTGFMRVYADSRGRPVMGEKTPAHLNYVETLLDWYPNGRVVHMLRDPRAVFVSDRHRRRGKPRKPYSWLMRVPYLFDITILLQTTIAWSGAARRHRVLQRRYPERYMLLRFEDLVAQPGTQLPRLFDFLGLPLPDYPTDVKVVSRGFKWGKAGLDAAAASRWCGHIHPLSERWLRFALRRSMRRLGYAD